jgi:DNA-binding NarL/FixJ family response regulator
VFLSKVFPIFDVMERETAERPVFGRKSIYLTPAELAIVTAIAEGKTSGEIAEERFVSKKTVEAQRRGILQRLGCRNMPHLITTLFREKILL